jgi:hypothetical protein
VPPVAPLLPLLFLPLPAPERRSRCMQSSRSLPVIPTHAVVLPAAPVPAPEELELPPMPLPAVPVEEPVPPDAPVPAAPDPVLPLAPLPRVLDESPAPDDPAPLGLEAPLPG